MTTPTPDALCERLRAIRGYRVCDCKVDEPINPDGPDAADLIQQQQATIERLSAALEDASLFVELVRAHWKNLGDEEQVSEAADCLSEIAAALGKDASDE